MTILFSAYHELPTTSWKIIYVMKHYFFFFAGVMKHYWHLNSEEINSEKRSDKSNEVKNLWKLR